MAEGTLVADTVTTVTLPGRADRVVITADGGDIWASAEGTPEVGNRNHAKHVPDGFSRTLIVPVAGADTVVRLISTSTPDYTVVADTTVTDIDFDLQEHDAHDHTGVPGVGGGGGGAAQYVTLVQTGNNLATPDGRNIPFHDSDDPAGDAFCHVDPEDNTVVIFDEDGDYEFHFDVRVTVSDDTLIQAYVVFNDEPTGPFYYLVPRIFVPATKQSSVGGSVAGRLSSGDTVKLEFSSFSVATTVNTSTLQIVKRS